MQNALMYCFGKVLKLFFNLEFQIFQSNTNFENSEKILNIRKFRIFRSKIFRIGIGTIYSVNQFRIFLNWN